ncbi:nitrogenase component 1 [[Clostridium] polysaccharolyticum]|uniref:Nitrogenase molybdenum-iron protein alpha chain n=1 Tax=[Clostridium] polysaccharolyticum TaxID=29364 RepID=A0A1I0BVB2_9FIRM|nr:nitrogenase component 1 [[Clostridium] polysaccharolyticum]SET11006.1 nitrogenase molybdenum-iron protein alpha chain [[Clostridium] polysaccharolyticum]
MGSRRVNLNLPSVENREFRLGTIISWDGNAKDLVEESNYEGRSEKRGGCQSGKEGGCKLCELNMPFSQQAMCCHAIIETQAANITDCVLVEHSPIGCSARLPRINLTYKGGLSRRGKELQNIKVVSTNLQEKDMVFGAALKLKKTIRDAYERYNPKAIFVALACSTAIIGEDICSTSEEMEAEIGIPVIPLECEGFRSKHWSTGFDIAQHAVLRRIVKRNPQKQSDLINIVALWGSDYFSEILKPLGLRVNYLIDMASFDELAQASEAVATTTFCHTLGSYFGSALETEFGVPQIHAPMPYGFAGTDAWIREIAKVTGKEDIVEAYIESEHKRVLPKIKELREKLKGVKGFVATGSAYAHAIIEVIKELGVQVDGSVVFHHDPVYDSGNEHENSLKFLTDNYGDIEYFSVSKTQQFQLYGLLKRVAPDFIIIRHNGIAPLALKMGVPAMPMGDEHMAVGYDGMIRVGEALVEILSRKKFGKLLQENIKLPYTDWWLNQEDPFLIGKHPEILETCVDRFQAENNEEKGNVENGR